MKEQCLCLLDSKKDNDVNEPHPIPRRLCVYNWDTFVCASESESCVRTWVNFVCAREPPSDTMTIKMIWFYCFNPYTRHISTESHGFSHVSRDFPYFNHDLSHRKWWFPWHSVAVPSLGVDGLLGHAGHEPGAVAGARRRRLGVSGEQRPAQRGKITGNIYS